MASTTFDPSQWSYYATFTWDETLVDNLNDNLGIPLSLFDSTLFNNIAKSDGGDIRITNHLGSGSLDADTAYSFELEALDIANEKGVVWFDASKATSTTTAETWRIYVGNSNASLPAPSDTLGRENVWPNDDVLIAHCDESSGDLTDSTSYGHDAIDNGSVGSDAGILGGARLFNGNNYFVKSAETDFAPSHDLTIRYWIRPDTLSYDGESYRPISRKDSSVDSYSVVQGDNIIGWVLKDCNSNGTNAGYLRDYQTAGTWFMQTLRYRASDGHMSNYLPGFSAEVTASLTDPCLNSQDIGIGGQPTGGKELNGAMDEIRFTKGYLSQAYLDTEYNNQSDPASFWTVSATQPVDTSTTYTVSTSTDTYTRAERTAAAGTDVYTHIEQSATAGTDTYTWALQYNLNVFINGVDRTTHVIADSFQKNDRIRNRASTLTFGVRTYGSKTYAPATGDEVEVYDGTTSEIIFGGVIVKMQERAETPFVLRYDITCKDWSHYLNRQLVTQTYENQTPEQIIQHIVDHYTADGFTATSVFSTTTISKVIFNRVAVGDAIEKLADLTNHSWYVDYHRDIHFYVKGSTSSVMTITDTSANYYYTSLVINYDIQKLRNRVLVEGGQKEGNERTENWTGADIDSQNNTLTLNNKFASAPAVAVGGTSYSVGVEFLDQEGNFDVLWNFNEKYLRFTSGSVPADSDSIAITGKPLIPIIVEVPDNASVKQYGVYEHAIREETLRSQDEAIDRAIAELDVYADELNEAEFVTEEPGLRAGQIITIDSTQRGLNEDLIIQSVRMELRTPKAERNRYRVRCATLKSVTLIDILKRSLKDEKLTEGELDTLLTFLKLRDTVQTSDTIDSVTTQTGPYYWEGENNEPLVWNFGYWD